MQKVKTIVAAAAFSTCLAATAVAAPVTIGGITYDSADFADDTTVQSGSFSVYGGAPDVDAALTGSDLTTGAFCFGSDCEIDILFTDNFVVNGTGEDLAVYASGTVEPFSLEIGGVRLDYSAVDLGFSAGGFSILGAFIDLDDFGIAAGALVSLVTAFPAPTGGDPEDFVAFAAINSQAVPVPAAALLFAPVALLSAARRKLKLFDGA